MIEARQRLLVSTTQESTTVSTTDYDPTSTLSPAEKAEAAEAAQTAYARQWFDLSDSDPDPIVVPIPDQHEPDTCAPRCEACTALLLALSRNGVVVWQMSDEGPLEVCGGEWVPMNASSQECTRCSEQRTIPDDCSSMLEHECGPAHRYHLEPYTGAEPRYEVREPIPTDLWREPRPADVSSMGMGPEVHDSVALPALSERAEDYADVIDYGSVEDGPALIAAETLLDAWIALQEAYQLAMRVLPHEDQPRFEAYLSQVFEHSSRMLGMQSIDGWMRDLVAALTGTEREEQPEVLA